MPQISPTEFYALPLRVHTFLADVPLHDVWAVDLPTHRDGVTLSEFLRRASQGGIMRLPCARPTSSILTGRITGNKSRTKPPCFSPKEIGTTQTGKGRERGPRPPFRKAKESGGCQSPPAGGEGRP